MEHRRPAPISTAGSLLPLLLLLLLATAPAAAEIGDLMAALSRVQEVRSAFREEKRLSGLTEPLASSGTLLYLAPDRVEKRTSEPFLEEIVVDGDRLTYAKPAEGVRRTVGLDAAPELRGLVEAVRGTLSGDLAALHRYYSVGLESMGEEGWRLTLVPVDERLRGFLKVVRIDGRETELRRVETIEPDGDVARMAIEPDPR
jgi:outer membrane lipoprotein-sorting protein